MVTAARGTESDGLVGRAPVSGLDGSGGSARRHPFEVSTELQVAGVYVSLGFLVCLSFVPVYVRLCKCCS